MPADAEDIVGNQAAARIGVLVGGGGAIAIGAAGGQPVAKVASDLALALGNAGVPRRRAKARARQARMGILWLQLRENSKTGARGTSFSRGLAERRH